jgi:predicted enzyme related to lactoylglutathione lyase
MPRVIHFEIHAEQPERAIEFYKGLFGWEFRKWDGPTPYWLIMTGPDSQPGINGGLLPRRGVIDGQSVIAYVCTADVASVDEAVAKTTALGGSIALAKMPIPGVGWLAYGKDTEGNIFGVMESDKTVQLPPP